MLTSVIRKAYFFSPLLLFKIVKSFSFKAVSYTHLGTELTILASCIIGGTSLRGGTGTVTGSLLGCILFATITNALLVMGVPTTWQNVVYGAILIIALLIDIFKRTKMSKA